MGKEVHDLESGELETNSVTAIIIQDHLP